MLFKRDDVSFLCGAKQRFRTNGGVPGLRSRLLLNFQSAGKCVKLDANTVLEAPQAANGDESRTGSGSTELGYFRRKMSQGTDWTLQSQYF